MAPGLLDRASAIMTDDDIRPSKRLRVADDSHAVSDHIFEEDDSQEVSDTVPPHPLGVKPSGNAYAGAASHNLKGNAGLFAQLPDELLTHFLEQLDARALVCLGHTCKALYAFCWSDELWKPLMTSCPPRPNIEWRGSWRSTFLNLLSNVQPIRCDGLFSDVLYRPFFCAHTSLKKFATGIPRASEIPRLDDLTLEEYARSWINKPFILTRPTREWPIFGKWNNETLLRDYPDVVFRAEAVDWTMQTYVDYIRNQTDESPLYLFDRSFAEKMKLRIGSLDDHTDAAYWAPTCFGDDLFTVLGDQRPDHRWMIMGPERSGSTFHKDPNGTSAWNAVLTGSKYWIMFPPNSPPPPGIIVSDDGSEVTAPVSIAEYLLAFHELARATPGCQEGICHAGEVLHVPSGCFHLVLNLEDSIALTQNFVSEKKLPDVLRFLRDTPDHVSGFRSDVADPYNLFVERLREKHPILLEQALSKLGARDAPTTWEKVKQADENAAGGNGGFSFGFGADDDDDDADIP